MSLFSNPAARSTEQATAYTAAVLDLLGSADPMRVLQDTPSALSRCKDGLTPGQLSQPESAGKWSITQVLQHLADSELVCGYRLRMVLAHDRPAITGYDQDLWATRLHYQDADPQQAIHDFTVVRQANVRLLASASADDLKRVGVHAERGEESVAHMIRLYAGHDLLHLQQIERIRRTVTK
ncbi:MAG TPA: DinB family protein [Vicinamibacterales bacterium]|nr:DinB family protein [Vicinamibacterales bacterium]